MVKVLVHEGYKEGHDIALIKLSKSVIKLHTTLKGMKLTY